MTPLLIGTVGVTNTGKTTLFDRLRLIPHYGFIEVGKEMRKRHPPEFFKGLGAMKDTESEVWEIVAEHYQAAISAGATVIFCDGQPRMREHVVELQRRFGDYSLIQLHAPFELLTTRASIRDAGDPSKQRLNEQRLHNDYRQLYDTLAEYHMQTGRVSYLVDATQSPDKVATTVIRRVEHWITEQQTEHS